MLGNDKSNVIVNYLFIKLVFVLKLLGLNGYLKGYQKSRKNKLPRKSKYKFPVRRCRLIKDISLLSFCDTILTEAHCVMIETMSSNKT